MKTIFQALEGKKTFFIAGGTIIYCLLGIFLHFMTIPTAIAFIGTAGSLGALRIGVTKVQGVLEVILEILKLIGQTLPAPTTTVTTITQPATVTTTTTPVAAGTLLPNTPAQQ